MTRSSDSRLSRRCFLAGALAGAGALASPAAGAVEALPYWMTVPRRVSLQNARTGEIANFVYWRDGLYDADALHRADRLMRDWRTGEVVQMAASLLDILWRLHMAARFTVPVQILSGYRSRQTNEALRRTLGESVAHRSFHIRAMAADIRLPGISTLAVAHCANRLGLGGVGYYPDSDFVHIDSGPRRTWVK